ncbi:MAG: hypothetical protein KDD45_04145 [Bdellovibrionales bacterium]|nr:hypothetical protein [Bdellovibrionales bacterium]
MRIFLLGMIVFLLHGINAKAGGIRTLNVNDDKMQVILLRMGKASVLRFSEKPKKVVIGNQNYYSIEFIENDLTLQPLGDVETNLFVYTPYHTYGFILKVCSSCSYDDLVYVKWKSKYSPLKKEQKTKPLPGFQGIGLKFNLDKFLNVLLVKTTTDPARSLRLIDLLIKYEGKAKLNLSGLRLIATRGGSPLKGQGYVVEKEILKTNETSKARLFIPLNESKGFTLNAWLDDKKAKIIIERKYLQ